MSLSKTMRKVDWEIKKGDLGKARDRLQGLLISYPDDLTLRRKLGEIYWQLHYPVNAGKYWYLEEERTPEMNSACKAFERSKGKDPRQILLSLKFRGDIQAIENQYAGKILLDLHRRSRKGHPDGIYLDFRNQGKRKFSSHKEPTGGNSKGCGAVALTAALFALVFIVIGIIATVSWAIQSFK